MLSYFKDGSPYLIQKGEFVTTGPIIVAIDSSKTNSCLFISDEYGNDICDFEFRGEAEDNVLEQCIHQRSIMKIIFNGASIRLCGIEDIVSKKDSEKRHVGMDEHESRFKITAIFMNFIIFFQEQFSITPELVNNWSWKAAVLPEKYRTKTYTKGSLSWHKDRNTKYAYRKDDVTDAHCIKEYMLIMNDIKQAIMILSDPEIKKHKAMVQLISPHNTVGPSTLFVYNTSITLLANITFMVNRVDIGRYATTTVSIRNLSAENIYTLCRGTFKQQEHMLTLAVGNGGSIT